MQIQKEATRFFIKQIQDEGEEINTNSVFITVQKEFNPAKKQTTKTTYRHPNYKCHFDQRRGQNEHIQKSYVVRQVRTSNQHTKQQMRRTTPQSHKIAPMKIDL